MLEAPRYYDLDIKETERETILIHLLSKNGSYSCHTVSVIKIVLEGFP